MATPKPYEHQIQTKIRQWVAECVPQPHVFFAFDRSRAQSSTQHIREKARGLRKGTPDTLLMVPGCRSMWVELKRPGGKLDDAQEQVARELSQVGHTCGVARSVQDYAALVRRWGVHVSDFAMLRAEHHDRVLLTGAIRREESPKPKRLAKPRAGRPSRSALAAAGRAAALWNRTP